MTRISEIMTRDVRVASPQDSIQQAAQCMKDLDVGSLPVCDGRSLLGMITDRDITIRASAAGLAPATTRVSEVMSPELLWCSEEASADDVLRNMGDTQVRRLPVLNADKELVGIVSLGDLSAQADGQAAEALRDISSPPAR
jgi:CBS domain-containing protein